MPKRECWLSKKQLKPTKKTDCATCYLMVSRLHLQQPFLFAHVNNFQLKPIPKVVRLLKLY